MVLSDGTEIHGPVILAIGHSARDTVRRLYAQGVDMEAKGFAMGVRLEHPSALIDRLQYHSQDGRGEFLPAAEYNFVTQADGRGVYSFCMCPGGVVVPAMSAPGQSVVNGMSASARSGRWSNSGMVVEIRPGDFPEYSAEGVFELMKVRADLRLAPDIKLCSRTCVGQSRSDSSAAHFGTSESGIQRFRSQVARISYERSDGNRS